MPHPVVIRAILRLVLCALLLGQLPPAALVQTTVAAPSQPLITVQPAPAATPASMPLNDPIASNPVPHPEPPPPSIPARAPIAAAPTTGLGRLPVAFVANAGQTDARVRYLAHGLGGTLFFTPTRTGSGLTHTSTMGRFALLPRASIATSSRCTSSDCASPI